MMNFSSLRKKQQRGGVALYTIIAVILMVITYIEFAIVEYKDSLPLSSGAILFWLFALSIVKYILVVWIFMHLKDDEKVLTGFFSVGMVIGGGTVAAMLLAFTAFNVSKVQRSPYMPTTNYARSTYDRMGIAEFDAPDFIDRMDSPAPQNQLFAIAPHEKPERSALNLPALNLQIPTFAEAVADDAVTEISDAPVTDLSDAPIDDAPVTEVSDAPVTEVSDTEVSDAPASPDDTPVQALATGTASDASEDIASEDIASEDIATAPTASSETVSSETETSETATSEIASSETDSAVVEAATAEAQAEAKAEAEALRQELAALQAEMASLKDELAGRQAPSPSLVEAVAFDNSTSYDWAWESLGEQAYKKHCSSCHQADGDGIAGAIPSLRGGHAHRFYNSAGGRYYLANVVLWGLKGPIDNHNLNYNGVMAGLESEATNRELAAALNHQLSSWGNAAYIEGDFYPIVPEDMMVVRNNPKTQDEVHALRTLVLQGDIRIEDFIELEPTSTTASTPSTSASAPAVDTSSLVAISPAANPAVAPVATEVTTLSYEWDWQSQGESAYNSHCSSCHQANGEGITGAFPALKDHIPHIYNAVGGRDYLVNLVLWGVQGAIQVHGTGYNSVMTGIGYISDEELAAALNHELTSWGNDALIEGDFAPIVPEEIAAARANQKSMAEVYEMRSALDLP